MSHGRIEKPSAASAAGDQQPIRLIIGRRRQRDGQAPDATTRAAFASMAQYRTRAPKGVFLYRSHEEMEHDRLRWTVAAVTEKARVR
jgi:hypothetical protein